MKVAVPWTSGYASGAALIGLTTLSKCAGIDEAAEKAKKVLPGMERAIRPSMQRPELWVTFIDDRGYLWFEEMPLPQLEQPRILNGHIRALTGLYWYYAHYMDETALALLRAGIKTVEEYAPAYRNPGGINKYDLLKESPDYGPKRTINQQDILFKMTGDPIFGIYRDVFEMDMNDEIKATSE